MYSDLNLDSLRRVSDMSGLMHLLVPLDADFRDVSERPRRDQCRFAERTLGVLFAPLIIVTDVGEAVTVSRGNRL